MLPYRGEDDDDAVDEELQRSLLASHASHASHDPGGNPQDDSVEGSVMDADGEVHLDAPIQPDINIGTTRSWLRSRLMLTGSNSSHHSYDNNTNNNNKGATSGAILPRRTSPSANAISRNNSANSANSINAAAAAATIMTATSRRSCCSCTSAAAGRVPCACCSGHCMATVLLWGTVVSLAVATVWYSYELFNHGYVRLLKFIFVVPRYCGDR